MKTTTKLALVVIAIAFFASRRARASSGAAVKLTDEAIKRIDSRVRRNYASALRPAMEAGDIVTAPRVAAFLAQILHETGGFQWLTEFAPPGGVAGQAYEGRADLGNTQPGDGPKYKGRGFIQLTGRYNYRKAGQDLGLDLEGNPELVSDPSIAAKTAVWFWTRNRLNAKADAGDFRGVTRAINPGMLHQTERERLYESAKRVLESSDRALV